MWPYLKYRNIVYLPMFQKDAILLEKVEHRMTKLAPTLTHLVLCMATKAQQPCVCMSTLLALQLKEFKLGA